MPEILMDLQVQTKTLNGSTTAYEFQHECSKWVVTNFGSANAYASFKATFNENEAIRIPPNCSRTVVANEGYLWCCKRDHSTIYVKGTGDIEVQQLCYH